MYGNMCRPIDCQCCKYSFFASSISTERKVGAGALIAVGVALATIFALGVAGVFPGVNANIPNVLLTFGTVGSLVAGFALAGYLTAKNRRAEFFTEFTKRLHEVADAAVDKTANGSSSGTQN